MGATALLAGKVQDGPPAVQASLIRVATFWLMVYGAFCVQEHPLAQHLAEPASLTSTEG